MTRVLLFWLAACGGEPTPAPAPPVEPVAEAPAPPPPAPEPAPEAPAASPAPMKLNADTATAEALKAGVPGITDKMVHEFEEYRPFKSVKRFQKELGKYVDEATVTAYLDHVFVPVDLNGSDAATLQQLPGLDDAEAKAVIDGRPYADRAAAEAALTGKVDDVSVAMQMVAAP